MMKTIFHQDGKTVEEIYLNPSDEIKEKVIGAQMPVLVSYVTYKVTYKTCWTFHAGML